mgnify:CR=1 FL=1|tara:strand:- start:10922 stop:11266 length:345 start_codon:yes stop_codon:yes gene_type:complete
MKTFSMELKDLEKLEKDTRRELSIDLYNLQHFFIEEPHNIYLLSLLTESYSLKSKLILELVEILREAQDIEEKDGKKVVPLEEKSLIFLQTAVIAKLQVARDLAQISRISDREV